MFESHYQSFEDLTDPSTGANRLKALHAELHRLGVDGFLVPRADQHQNEYVAPAEERLAWLTGFTGSAGIAVVLKAKAAIFVDGRYTLAVRDQVNIKLFTPVAIAETSPETWIAEHAGKGLKLGFDPWLHTPAQIERFRKALTEPGIELVALEPNPIDAIWTDRPPAPLGTISLQAARFAGEFAARKLARVSKALGKKDAQLISDPHAVAWLFNIRGQDVSHTPLPLAYALIVKSGKPKLYVDPRKLTKTVSVQLAKLADIVEPAGLMHDLAELASQRKTIGFDAATISQKLTGLVEETGGASEVGTDPIALMKACKNPAELNGTREAHLRDGAAITSFLCWFAENAPSGKLTEIDAAEALETFRRDTFLLKDISFPSIAAAGPNAAIPHYKVTLKTNRRIGKGIFLIDSGGQYEDGTTDITRTLAVGKPTTIMRDRFTRVLQGHIAIARAVFPKGTSGAQIDALARYSLWQAGLDFDHGTGHGVGAYLSVHEGPQRISKIGSVPLEPGMIVSNEPGYYNAGQWGIRIENLVIVEPREIAGAERTMFGFETITLAPIDVALIEPKLLSDVELTWLNAYHARVFKVISPLVKAPVARWLRQVTKPLHRK
jgi:Xaa-Pro aminopeptidase